MTPDSEARRITESQEELKTAQNANVIEQAGAPQSDTPAPHPTPGNRLSAAEVEKEISSNRRASDPAGRPAAPAINAIQSEEASNDQDSNLASGEEVADRAISIAAQRPG